MLSTTSLIRQLEKDFPRFTFIESDLFFWSFKDRAIFYNPAQDDAASLLHELAHGELMHASYTRDIQLLEMERDAWQHALEVLAPRYGVTIEDHTIQEALDTYREWLFKRSTCPRCAAVGIEQKKATYTCLACHSTWRVNDGRQNALRRYL